MRQIAVCYGTNAIPIFNGTTAAPNSRTVAGAVPAVGSGFSLPAEPATPAGKCSGKTKAGTDCGARPAKGTEMCVGHLRSEGRL